MQDNDVIADLRADGRYVLRQRSAATGRLVLIKGQEDDYDEKEMYRRLNGASRLR